MVSNFRFKHEIFFITTDYFMRKTKIKTDHKGALNLKWEWQVQSLAYRMHTSPSYSEISPWTPILEGFETVALEAQKSFLALKLCDIMILRTYRFGRLVRLLMG